MSEENLYSETYPIELGILDKGSPEFIQVKSFSDKFNRKDSMTFDRKFFDWQYDQSSRLFQMGDNGFYFCKKHPGQIIGYCSASNASYLWNGKEVPGRFFHEWYSDPDQSGSTAALLARQLELSPILQVMGASAENLNILLRMRPSLWFPLRRLCAVLDAKRTSYLVDKKSKHSSHLLSALLFKIPELFHQPGIKEIQRFDEDYQETWEQTSRNFVATVNKSAGYMNWRYVDHPVFSYFRHVYTNSKKEQVYIVWRSEHVTEKKVTVARICEVIGSSENLSEAMLSFIHELLSRDVVFTDFFCTNDAINSALTAIGFYEAIPLEELDIPRLFSPLQTDFRKTLHSAISFSSNCSSENSHNVSDFYFTKGDTNQDMPNR
jgi:hypothetical protein